MDKLVGDALGDVVSRGEGEWEDFDKVDVCEGSDCTEIGTFYCGDCSKFFCEACDADAHEGELSEHERVALSMQDDEMEDEIIEVEEDELLAVMDKHMDPFTICAKLFKYPQHVDYQNLPIAFKLIKPQHAQHLQEHGYAVVDGFISPQQTHDLRVHTLELARQGLLRNSLKATREDDPFRDTTARGDLMTWIHAGATDQSPIITDILDTYVQLRHELQSILHLQESVAVETDEYQLAYYPGNGAGYVRHRDGMPVDGSEEDEYSLQQRRVTAILYTNENWEESHGGKLKVWLRGGEVKEIEPRAGRLLLFLSGAVDHEVMPSFSERVAITAWYR